MMSLKHHKKLLRLCVALACVNAMLGDIPGLQVAKACPWIKSTRNVRAPASQYQSGHKAWPIFALVWSLGEDHADFHCLVRLDACAEITDATTGMEIEAQLELLRQDVGSVFAELPWPAAACRGLLLSSAALVCLACSPSCLGLLLPAAPLVCLACSPSCLGLLLPAAAAEGYLRRGNTTSLSRVCHHSLQEDHDSKWKLVLHPCEKYTFSVQAVFHSSFVGTGIPSPFGHKCKDGC